MNGRVLSEEEIQRIAEVWDIETANNNQEMGESIIFQNLIATIRDYQRQSKEWETLLADRDKTIAELQEHFLYKRHERARQEVERLQSDLDFYHNAHEATQRQNTILCEALEWYADESSHYPERRDYGDKAREALAKVKELNL